MNLRKPLSFFVAAAMTVTALCSAIGFAEEPGAQPVGEWITNSDGSYTYIQGDDPAAAISSLKLDSSSVGDWSDVQYVSVDISVQGTAQVVLGATVGENWSNVNETVASSETTLTIFTNGKDVPYGVDIGVWQYAEDIYADAGTIITVSNVKFSTELPPRENGVWYEEPDGSFTYTHGDDPTVEVPTIKPNSSSVNDWSAVKYISVDVSVEGKAQVALNSVVGETWTYVSETITSSEKTLVLQTNGKNIPNGIAINVWKYNDTDYATAGAEITISNITFSTEELARETGVWYEEPDGSFTYTQGDDPTASIEQLPLDISGVTDWSAVKYISATVNVDGTAKPALCAQLDEWKNATAPEATISSDECTIYLVTNGKTATFSCIQFWAYNETDCATAGTKITVSDIVFSTEELPRETGVWYEEPDGSFTYTHGDDPAAAIPQLPLDISGVADFSAVKYISATVAVDGKAQPALCAQLDEWKNATAPEATISSDESTIYLTTNGKTATFSCIQFWKYNETDCATAGAKITVSDIVFSTEELARETGRWYEEADGSFTYTHGDDPTVEIPQCPLVLSDVSDWSKIGYISANVSVEGTARPVFEGFTDLEYNNWESGVPAQTITDSNIDIYIDLKGNGSAMMNVGFWNINETDYATAGAVITISDITFHEEKLDYETIVGALVQLDDGTYFYNHGDLEDSFVWLGSVELPENIDISDVQTISFNARTVGNGVAMVLSGDTADGKYESPFSRGRVEKKVRGKLTDTVDFSAMWVLTGTKIYISDLVFSTEPIIEDPIDVNGLMIDDTETEYYNFETNLYILDSQLANIDQTGVLKLYTEHIIDDTFTKDSAHWYQLAWCYEDIVPEYGTNWIEIDGHVGVGLEDGDVIEVEIDEKTLAEMGKCTLSIQGEYFKYIKAIFVPTPDAPKPEADETDMNDITDEDKAALDNSRDNTISEDFAPVDGSDFEYGEAQGHRSNKKWNDEYGWVYALRIVEKVDKELLKHAENVTITVYSKKADQYITFKADTCFSFLNINGQKVKAGGKDAFLTVILDNIPEDDELTFTGFTINYKK